MYVPSRSKRQQLVRTGNQQHPVSVGQVASRCAPRKEVYPFRQPRLTVGALVFPGQRHEPLIKHPNRLAGRPVYLFARDDTATCTAWLGQSKAVFGRRVGGKPGRHATRTPFEPVQDVAADDQMVIRRSQQEGRIRGHFHSGRPKQLACQAIEGENPVTV